MHIREINTCSQRLLSFCVLCVTQCICRILSTESLEEFGAGASSLRRLAESTERGIYRGVKRARDSRISNNRAFVRDSAPSLASNNACIKGARDNQS